MKKHLFIILSLFSVSLIWCTSTDKQITKIDPLKWEQLFNNQIEEFQYIIDFEDFISYNILSITEDKPYSSDFSLAAKFDKNSSIQWWIEISQNKFSPKNNLETSDITFNINAESSENDTEPFETSWSISLLYQNNEVYAKLHNLNVFMWEGNMVAKMYSLLWDMIIDKWVNLEVHSGWVVEVDENDNKRLPYIVWTFKNTLKSEWIHENSPNFLSWIATLIDTVNSYIDLWISTNGLSLLAYDIDYFQSDKTIQKVFTWRFQSYESEFSLSFTASKDWFEMNLYDIKGYGYDENWLEYKDIDQNFMFSLQEDKKSEYWVKFESTKYRQKIANITWKIKYWDSVKFSADFELQPLEIIEWQKISWKLNWTITKQPWNQKNKSTELTWEILLLSEILSSL